MKIKTTILSAAIVLGCFCSQSFGSVISRYLVSSTGVVNHRYEEGGVLKDAPHGLWTSGDRYGTNKTKAASYYDIKHPTLFTEILDSDGTRYATLVGSAENQFGIKATIELRLDDYLDDLAAGDEDHYKKEQGLAYNPNKHDFYESISGSISFHDENGVFLKKVKISKHVGDHHFQFGDGANAKSDKEFGASAWIQDADGESSEFRMGSGHWDLNLTFSTVPEPMSVVVWSVFGAGGLAFSRIRRKNKK